MTKRVSITLAICTIGAIVAVGALFLPARQASTATPAPVAAVAADTTDQSAPAAAAAQTVSIQNFSFAGATTVSPGEQITVSNVDSAPHTMTANDGSFDTGILNNGSTATLTMPTTPGTYQFFCSLHPSMVSTITVQS